MHKDFRKACALTVTASMILSLASCSLLDKAKDQIIDQAGEVADAAVSMKADDLAELCGLDDDAAEELELAFSMNSSSDAVVAAIADTITYEVDEDSAEGSTKDGEGSVDVVFTMVDYEAVAEDEENTADEDTFVAALGDSEETKEVTVSMEFELDDEDWICTNFEGKDFEKLYEFLDFEIAFGGNLVEIAESFADAVIAMDTDALYTICDYASTGYYSSPEDLEYWLSTDLASYPDIAAVVASTLSYEIDEDSATLSDNGSGTIDITFSMVDYQGCAEAGEYEDSAALADALGSWTGERTVQHTWTIGVNDAGESYVDPEWLYDVYDFLYFYPSFSMNFDGDYTSVVDHTEWWWDDGDGVYTNSSEIELDVIPVAAAQDYSFSWDFFYTVAYNGTVVYCSTNKTDFGMYIESYFYPSDVSYLTAPDGNFYAGAYTISFYDLNGNMFATDTCTVENTSNGAYTGTVTEVPVAVGSGSGSAGGSGTVDADFTFNVGEAVYYDDTFYYATYDPVWFDVPGDAFVDTGIYPSGTSQIQMTVQLNGTYQDSIEYEYYYSATQPTSVDDLTLVDSGVAGITTYGSYDYYDCDFTGTVQDGYYLCALYPDATGDLLAYNVCKVG